METIHFKDRAFWVTTEDFKTFVLHTKRVKNLEKILNIRKLAICDYVRISTNVQLAARNNQGIHILEIDETELKQLSKGTYNGRNA